MSVTHTIEEDKLILALTGGDREKLDAAKNKHGFKNYQCLLRYCVSILLLNENKHVTIKYDGFLEDVIPANHLLEIEGHI